MYRVIRFYADYNRARIRRSIHYGDRACWLVEVRRVPAGYVVVAYY
jgi:hypothetical protein